MLCLGMHADTNVDSSNTLNLNHPTVDNVLKFDTQHKIQVQIL